ncbi:unnamed protein product [Schistosoma curassoni]|uniref:PB1 domain-containing protein n=1 Tax=Schistosoma curassoni TaxID=6186 RepID=A0A183KN75_9TREM|nr:unnamed protein product [Schistosoma curassoni]
MTAHFNKLVRAPKQTIKDFIIQLRIQASKCNFGEQLHIRFRDRLIAGINNSKLQNIIQILFGAFQADKDIYFTYEDFNNDPRDAITKDHGALLSNVKKSAILQKPQTAKVPFRHVNQSTVTQSATT